MTMLETVKETLKNFPLVTEQHLIAAKVPILRIKCGGAFSDILVDLNVNNSVAIRNTHLMCYYSGCKSIQAIIFVKLLIQSTGAFGQS